MQERGNRRSTRGHLPRRWLVVLGGILSAIALFPATHASPQSPQPLVQHKRSGAVQLTLHTDRQTMGFADWLRLTLVVDTPLDMAVVFPQVGNALGSFTIHSQRPPVSRTTSSRTRQWQQEYILAAERLGTLTIPPLTVTVQATNAVAVAQPQRLTTEALTITVVPSLPDDADVTAPKDIAPPVLLERPGRRLWLWGVAGGLGLLAGAWWRYRRRRPNRTGTLQPAHVLALEALQRLQSADLLSEQRIDEFYMRLSHILRCYIGWRFGLRAPALTTEELLAAAPATVDSLAIHANLLSVLLHRCDLVKFACHQPTPHDIQQDVARVKDFVLQTADTQVVIAVPLSGGSV